MNDKIPPNYIEVSLGVFAHPSRINSCRVHAEHQKQTARLPLVASQTGEETRWYGSARRFEITFRIYAVKPCDWDGWDIKRLQDWCIVAGLIPNDGWQTLSGRVDSRKVSRASEEKTEIIITAIDPTKGEL